MTDLPEPLTPPDCDLRDYLWMPLDVRRLLNSETWILGSPEVKVACMTLWCEAWQQVPAASLPDNDRMIAHLSGAGPGWKKIAAEVLKGWQKCSDGRLYHPVVAEKAREAWASVQRCRARVIRRLEMESGVWSTLRREVFARDDFTCRYCGVRGVRLECDHIHPLSRGGVTELDNLAACCRPCNRRKGARLVSEWMQ
jgi:5-methylcytosine-specific restriction endonuclease McrA